MSKAIQDECRELIAFYDANGWDWSMALAFHITRMLGDTVVKFKMPTDDKAHKRPGRPKSTKSCIATSECSIVNVSNNSEVTVTDEHRDCRGEGQR